LDERILEANLRRVRAGIDAAARRTGREPSEVMLVAVTKSVGAAEVLALARLGVRDFGENRTADLLAKRAALEAAAAAGSAPPGARWHMIGHLQRNKVRKALAAIDALHSLDSLDLAGVVSAETVRSGRGWTEVHVQVNVAGEATKGGFAPEELAEALPAVRSLPGLRPVGLMTMAPWTEDPEASRPVFRRLRELRDWACTNGYLDGSRLSMGMSVDREIAVEEGSTCVRVGRALFVSPEE
jgi:hypothetical protein